jgi:hypothetical protein
MLRYSYNAITLDADDFWYSFKVFEINMFDNLVVIVMLYVIVSFFSEKT